MKQYIKYYLSNNITEYIKVFCVFAIGIIISIIVVNNSTDIQKEELNTYITERIEIVKNSEKINNFATFKNSIWNNTKELFILVFLSSTILGLPIAYYIVARKGFSIGYTISAIYATQDTKKAIIFICNSMILHNIIYVVSIFIVLVSGINFIKSIINKRENLKFEIVKLIIFILIAFSVSIISSLSEAYISTNLMLLFKKYL